MTTKKPHIFKKGGWWRVSHWTKHRKALPLYNAAHTFVYRLNSRQVDMKTLEQQPYKRGGLCP